MMAMDHLLSVEDLSVVFRQGGNETVAVDHVSFHVDKGETLALVGESGSGKSVTALSILKLLAYPAASHPNGRILFKGQDLIATDEAGMRKVRGNDITMVFQEPMTSLNPLHRVSQQIGEILMLHKGIRGDAARARTVELLTQVGIRDAEKRLDSYPHELSGGQRQRVMIAMSLANAPDLLIADEPTTALDVTVQAQILELLSELQQTRGMSIMLITHDLGVVAQNADVVCVMYAGRVVEYAPVERLFETPLHPYTRGLFNSIPSISARRARLQTIADHIDDAAEFPAITSFGGETLRPWWPWHEPPRELAAMPEHLRTDPSADYVLVEASPQHWIGAWRTSDIADVQPRFPEIQAGARAV